jgi:transcriptional regulator with XRE-family HTH domain
MADYSHFEAVRYDPPIDLPVYCKQLTIWGFAKQPDARSTMGFGEKIRSLRKSKDLTQKELGDLVGVTFAYVSKVENERLDFGDYPSEDLIRKLAAALGADEDELMLLAKKIPEHIRQRVFERPDAFRKFADLGDADIDRLLEEMEKRRRRK